MAPLSILPGRIRYEDESLRGDICGCRHLEARLNCLEGVIEASANHRTGRITIRFDESRAERNSLEGQVKNALICKTSGSYSNSTHSSKEKASPMHTSGTTGHTVIDVLARAILPKPFNVLLPMALQTMRR